MCSVLGKETLFLEYVNLKNYSEVDRPKFVDEINSKEKTELQINSLLIINKKNV